MPPSAVLVLEHPESPSSTDGLPVSASSFPSDSLPITCQEAVGKSTVERTVQRLLQAGFKFISLVTQDTRSQFLDELCKKYREIHVIQQPSWLNPDGVLQQLEKCAEQILIVKLGAYIEFDVGALLKFCNERKEPVVRLHDGKNPLDAWLLDAARSRENGSDSHWLSDTKAEACPFFVNGYVNRLRTWHDFRRMVADILMGHCQARPSGREIQPGVWLDDGARLDRNVRIVGPVYIGRGTRVRGSALIARCTNLERSCEVGSGTTVEDTSLLPFTRVGHGINVAHAIVKGSQLFDMRRLVVVDIRDITLMSRVASPAGFKVRSNTAGPSSSGAFNTVSYPGAPLSRFLEDES